jgi:hypothetical protein
MSRNGQDDGDAQKKELEISSGRIAESLPSSRQPEARDDEKLDSTADMEAVPQPEDHPEPPYTVFGHGEKIAIILLVSFTAVISPFSSSIYLPALTTISEDMNVSLSLINLTVTTYLVGSNDARN